MSLLTFEQFRKQYIVINEKKGVCRIKMDFFDRWGNTTFLKAYNTYMAEVTEFLGYREKIEKFESFLRENGISETQSNISESRYYFWNGVKYRFSSHIYPTGSMTKKFEDIYTIVDFAADPQIINEINF